MVAGSGWVDVGRSIAPETMPRRAAPKRRALDSQATALLAAHTALEKQAEAVVVMDVRRLSSVTDFFVVCTAGSARQIAALKDAIETALTQQGCTVWHTEGTASAPSSSGGPFTHEPQWVLMDCGEIVVHLLDQHARAFYRLEDLWADAPRVPIA